MSSLLRIARFRFGWMVFSAVIATVLVACNGETAIPIDINNQSIDGNDDGDGTIPPPDVTHTVIATPEMEGLARQQCLDDPELAEGYVRVVDPESGEILVEFAIDCAEVRTDG